MMTRRAFVQTLGALALLPALPPVSKEATLELLTPGWVLGEGELGLSTQLWSAPRSWVPGELVTAQMMNDIRDGLA